MLPSAGKYVPAGQLYLLLSQCAYTVISSTAIVSLVTSGTFSPDGCTNHPLNPYPSLVGTHNVPHGCLSFTVLDSGMQLSPPFELYVIVYNLNLLFLSLT